MEREPIRCVAPFGNQLVPGEDYPFLDYDAKKDRVRVIDRRNRWRWYSADHFQRIAATSPGLVSYTLDDPIHDPLHDCIEVTLELAGGQKRWCFFVTARWLLQAMLGELEPKSVESQGLELTQITHLADRLAIEDGGSFRVVAVPHMIVVSELSESVVAETLGHLAGRGTLRNCTKLLRRRPKQAGSRIMAQEP